MQRLLVRIAVLALSASTLSACGMFGGGSTDDNAMVMPSGNGRSSISMPADLNSAVHQAQVLRQKGDLDGATRILSQLMLAAPDDAGVVGEYGKLLVQQGRSDDAAQFLRRAVELQPNDWSLYSALGVAYDQLSDPANAKLAYEHALALNPSEPAILNNYAMSRMLAGDTTAARALMIKAQASGSTDPKIARNLALLDSMAPVKPVVATASVTAKPAAPVATVSVTAKASAPAVTASVPATPAALRTAITTSPIPAVVPAAHGAPVPLIRGSSSVVMQEVPVDPLAGPRTAHVAGKAVKTTHHPVQQLAVNAPKPATKVKPAADHIPALRMTADAGKP